MTGALRRTATGAAALVACMALTSARTLALTSAAGARAALTSALTSAAGARAATAAAPDVPSARVAGLEQTWETPQGTWAVIAMGHLDSSLNTFWQLLFRPAGTSRWSLVTPRGVASNGGLSAATGGPAGAVIAGFQPSKHLSYSPLAETTDEGRHWRAGVLPAALVFAADAVAVDGRNAIALVRSAGGALVRAEGSITRWSSVATVASLGSTAAGRACKPSALSAVAVAGGVPEVGADCAEPGTVGLFRDVGGTWVSSAPKVADARTSTLDVVRLWSGPAGTTALIEGTGAGTRSLVVAWRRSPAGRWAVSAPAAFAGDVLSTATGAASTGAASAGAASTVAASSVAVVTSAGWHAHAVESIAGPGARWRSDRTPAGTQEVAFAGGGLDALVVHASRVSVWRLGASGRWHDTPVQVTIPIVYGSST